MHFQEDGDGKLSHLEVWRCVGTIGGGAAANVGGVMKNVLVFLWNIAMVFWGGFRLIMLFLEA